MVENQSLLGRPFDQYQNLMQIAHCIREVGRQIGTARPRVLELSRRPTGLADYLPDAEIHRHATHERDVPTPSAWRPLPFDAGCFDACVVSDVYEHIARDERPRLLSEMMRVTHGALLLGCPIESEIVTRFDRFVFDFIWGKYAERFEPLEQHITFGVEPLDQVMDSLRTLGAARVVALPCNYIFRWIHMSIIYLDLQHGNPFPDVCEPINLIYNELMSPFDYREPCYRYLIVAATDPRLSLDRLDELLRVPPEPAEAARITGALLEAFRSVDSRACDALRRVGGELERLNVQLRATTGERDQIIRALQAELHAKVGERDALIRSLQEELHASVGERDRMIRGLQRELQTKVAERDCVSRTLQDELLTKVRPRASRRIVQLFPSTAVVGQVVNRQPDGSSAIAIQGTGFSRGDRIYWNGQELVTTFSTPDLLTARVPEAFLRQPGVVKVSVRDVFHPGMAELVAGLKLEC